MTNKSDLPRHEKEYFAMKGALQAIEHADPETPSSELRQIAKAVREYTEQRPCAVCLAPTSSRADPPLCSDICRRVYTEWSRVIDRDQVAAGGAA